ncbi:hypothetical protein PTSG_02741 [Salpingoeca rosetta]|uniref:Uncharacterized protein n=1 Tax=Salpingoeca rosetta (strain ATCC 50818 / BSB-021) TaxID=946362 RepID=F2U366_SALR5|nr:uncharacterized protein PTSG_02741 [Salpingoeca rosetta]EGD82060.1 hypothetical protein PTSG_02741 [Salpingoeca rosetta]|eukprot:XP_004996243.1 hypothetical protein PTSG_02741 [Salpingoeca rosetta]
MWQVSRVNWQRLESWRYASNINKSANMKRMLPGFLIGTGMFVVAVGLEAIANSKKKSSH